MASLSQSQHFAERWRGSHKQVSPQALEQNQRVRDAWIAKYGDIPADWCLWLDEASVDYIIADMMNLKTKCGLAVFKSFHEADYYGYHVCGQTSR